MSPRRFWREMASAEFTDCADWVAVLPLAATEQHGPHLPLGVDAMIAEGLVARAAAALPAALPVTFLPLQEVTKSDEHARFPGTLTLGWETVIRAWLDIGASVARAGLRKLVLITSHGGNAAAMEIAAREMRATGLLAITTSWGRLGNWQDVYPYPPGQITDIHGGLSETSLMLALRSDLVDMSRAEDFASAQAGRDGRLGWHGAPANAAWLAGDLNPRGVVGNAAAATAELGEADIAGMIAGFTQLMTQVHAMDPPQ